MTRKEFCGLLERGYEKIEIKAGILAKGKCAVFLRGQWGKRLRNTEVIILSRHRIGANQSLSRAKYNRWLTAWNAKQP